jgi:glucose-1-phosphate adenylyltransferase
MILAGGKGKRLFPLTIHRTKPAVPFGGRYRIVDFVLSNFINSNLYKIKVLTQYKSDSLNKHIFRHWRMSTLAGQFVEVVPAQMRTGQSWYKGSADAIFQNLHILLDERPTCLCVFGADHIYKMDIHQMLDDHMRNKADCTVAAIPVPIKEASAFGCIAVDENNRIIAWEEKPEHPTPMPGRPGFALASMGNYVFKTDMIMDVLKKDAADPNSSHDFGKDIIPSLVGKAELFAYDFNTNHVPGQKDSERGYWRDVGTIESFWESNMDLISEDAGVDIYNESWPIISSTYPAPPAKFSVVDRHGRINCCADHSLIAEGCVINGGNVINSILFRFCKISPEAHVEGSILMNGVEVGEGARIRRAIIDKFVKIPPGAKIGYNRKEDERRFHVSPSGIVVIAKGTIVH